MSNQPLRTTAFALCAATLLAFSFAACSESGPDPTEEETGVVQVSAALTQSDITSVTYEITGADIDPPLTGDLTVANSEATGTIAGVPSGDNRVITVRAFAGATQVCEGTATFSVTKGQTTNVNVLFECDDLVGSINVAATFNTAFGADAAFAQVVAADAGFDVTVPLSIAGDTVRGMVMEVPAGTGRVVTVSTSLAGATQCTGAMMVDVVAGQSADATGIVLSCGEDAGAVAVSGTFNFKPRIHAVFASNTAPNDGQSVDLSAVATDPDGDSLSYTWSSDVGGSFGDTSLAQTTWDSAGLAGQTATLQISVTDGITTAVTGQVVVTVGTAPPPAVLINEVAYDGPGGTDPETVFIELWGPAGADLSGFTLVAINGSTGSIYDTIDLNGQTIPDDGFFVMTHSGANTATAAASDMTDDGVDLQNGDDALQLHHDGSAVDAVAYGADAASHGEGTAAEDVAEGWALTRGSAHADTGNNADDFKPTAFPSPGGNTRAPDWWNLQSPHTISTTAGETSEPVFGQIHIAGVTDAAGAADGVAAQLGWGAATADPGADPASYTWVDATFNVDSGNNDEYQATITQPEAQPFNFLYTYRYSLNGGLDWHYADTTGSDDGYDAAALGTLSVAD
jgi:hypothetical protein